MAAIHDDNEHRGAGDSTLVADAPRPDDHGVESGNVPQTQPRTILVLPAYNEESTLPALLDRVQDAMTVSSTHVHVIVVDDGSTDDTGSVANAYQKRLSLEVLNHEQNQGLGETVRDGLLHAAKIARAQDVVVSMDADNTHPPALMEQMVGKVREGNDVVIASRYRYGSRVLGLSGFRSILSLCASLLFRVFLPMKGVRDYTCGYRAYRGEFLKAVTRHHGQNLTTKNGFECLVDILLRLHEAGAIISEVPLILRYDQKVGASKMRVGRTILATLKLLASWRLARWGIQHGAHRRSRIARAEASVPARGTRDSILDPS